MVVHLLTTKKQREMKKFWNLLVAVLVVMGAVACTENIDNVDGAVEQGLSFRATINLDETRSDVVFNEATEKWNTVWTGDETLNVRAGYMSYQFTNSVEDKELFVCKTANASDLVGKDVVIDLMHDADGNTIDSKAGKSGGKISASVSSFNPAEGVALEVKSAFFRYSSAYEVTLDASSYIFCYNGSNKNTITLPAGDDVWVAFNPLSDITLSYSIDGTKCKEITMDFVSKKIYNLGELGLPYEVSETWGIVGEFNGWAAGTPAPLYVVNEWLVAYGLTNLNDGFKFVQNKGWDNAKGGVPADGVSATGEWLNCGTNNITVADASAYDVYFAPERSMYCIVVAGAEVPEMPEAPVFSVGMVGFNGNWDADVDMTLEGDYYVIKGQVVAANDQFKIRISHSWDESYGMPGDVEPQTVNADAMYSLVQGGKNMSATAGTYDIYFNYVAKEFYLLTPGTTPEDLAIPQYKIYVYNHETNWANVYLYTWDSNDTHPMGAWPGSLSHSTEIINGYEYLVWTMPRTATGMSLNAILNNNSDSQTADYVIGTLSADVYLRLNNGVLESIDDKNNPEPVIPIETYKVYVYKYNNTWTTLNLYSWDAQSQAAYTGVWPGTKNALTEDINGYTYYVWEMPATATGKNVKFIINNGSSQTGDSDAYALTSDLYLRLNGAAIQLIEDKNNPEPTVEPQPRKIYATTTLSWTKMNIYAWNGGVSFSWPGVQMSTETINETKYYVYTFDKSNDGATINVIFNNGSAQTVDITNVKLDKDRFFRVLTTKSGNNYKYEEIADPR